MWGAVAPAGCRQFPTAAVNGEMRFPHGSDWPSIREAGSKPVPVPSPMGRTGSRQLWVVSLKGPCAPRLTPRDAGERTSEPSLGSNQPNGLTGWPKTGMARGRSDVRRSGIHPQRPGGQCDPTTAQNGCQERSNPARALRMVDGGAGANRMRGRRKDGPRSQCPR